MPRRFRRAAHFNPRSPHGERPEGFPVRGGVRVFQPTLPARGATPTSSQSSAAAKISTHAPRTGSDSAACSHRRNIIDFNPRSPHGERPRCRHENRQADLISTHAPRTGSDNLRVVSCHSANISTHAPRTGSDRTVNNRTRLIHHFNPRSPHGERLLPRHRSRRPWCISTHAPRTESDFSHFTCKA